MILIPAFLLTFSSIFLAVSGTNCDNLGILIYEDLGCTPRYKNNGSCPEEYSCDGLEEWTDKCHYRGKTYSDEESVRESESTTLCIYCQCQKRAKTQFLCIYLDCFGNVPKPGCKNIFPIKGCCPPVEKCVPFATCEVDGKTYEEGDVFYLKDKCVRCQCEKAFKLEEPFCTRQRCGEQLIDGDNVQKKCAPLYSKTTNGTLCCPKTWICLWFENDELIGAPYCSLASLPTLRFQKSLKVVTQNLPLPDGTETFKKATEGCMFGEQIVEKGQNFTKNIGSGQVTCQCSIPPLLTCIED